MGWKTRKDKLNSEQPDADATLENESDQDTGYDPDMEADAAALARLAQVSAADADADPFVLDLNNDAFRTDSQRTSLDPSAFPWFKPGTATSSQPPSLSADPGSDPAKPRPAVARIRGRVAQSNDDYAEPSFGTPSFEQPAAGPPSFASPEVSRPFFETPAPTDAAPVAPSRGVAPEWNSAGQSGGSAPEWDNAAQSRGEFATVVEQSWTATSDHEPAAWAAPRQETTSQPSPPSVSPAFDVPPAFDDPSPSFNGSPATPTPPSAGGFGPAIRGVAPDWDNDAPSRGPHIAPFQPVTGFAPGIREPEPQKPRVAPFQPVTPTGPQEPPAQPAPQVALQAPVDSAPPPVQPSIAAGPAYYQQAGSSASPYPTAPPPVRPDVEGQSINSFSREAVAPGLVTGEGDYNIPKVAPFIVAGGVPEAELGGSDGHYLIIRMRNLAASYKLTKDVTTIGRPDSVTKNYPDVEIELDDGVSRRHAEIRLKNNQYYVVDVGSKNGTLLNGDLLDIDQENRLAHGDRIRVGERTEIVFE
jgi:hypothetical protein